MPGKKKYTKAQKAAYAKKMAKMKKKPKKVVVRQNQFRTEFKDKISQVFSNTIAANPANWDPAVHSPLDSSIMLPHALFNTWTTGTQNGQIDGNQINARYLNMKVELDFSDLPVIVRSDDSSQPAIDQNYHIVIRQCLILEDIRDFLRETYVNPNSRRTQPAYDGTVHSPPQDNTPLDKTIDVARRALNRQFVESDFLSYQRRNDSKVRVLKKIIVKGNLNKRFGTENMAAVKIETTEPADPPVYTLKTRPYPTPNQHFTFNWKMPKDKLTLQPVVSFDDSTTPPTKSLIGHYPGKTWIPCVMVSCKRDVVDYDIAAHPLRVRQISHFTYTDN
jgi:hypothetical protein